MDAYDAERIEDEEDFDYLEELLDVADLAEAQQQQQQEQVPRAPVWRRNRLDPLNDNPNVREFKARYRFNCENVMKIVELVRPHLHNSNNNRGLPCTIEQIVCSGLEELAGGQFFRVAGYASGICKGIAWNHLYKFVDAILVPAVRGQFLYMPSAEQQRQNMESVYDKYKLTNVIAGVDGCHIPFLEKPRGVPTGRDPRTFQNRKGLFSINSQIICGFDRRI